MSLVSLLFVSLSVVGMPIENVQDPYTQPEELEISSTSVENAERSIAVQDVAVEEVLVEPKVKRPEADKIFEVAEEMAQFPGGQSGLMRFLCENLKYPKEAQKQNIEGRVIVRFVVNKDGTISNPVILRGVDKYLDREAIRVVKLMPKWIPAKNNTQAVSSYYTLPIVFKVQK